MSNCASCGATLGLGRYCTNCGARADQPARGPEESPAEQTVERRVAAGPGGDPTATAERPAVPGPVRADSPPPPPPPLPPPPLSGGSSRYPLYADEVGAPPAAPAAGVVPPILTPTHRQERRGGGAPWLVVLLVGVLLLMALVGWLLLRGDGDEGTAGTAPAPTPTEGTSDTGGASSEPTTTATGPSEDLTGDVEVEAPRPAPPGRDLAGNRVTYPTSNMFDGRSETAYRMQGNASGEVLTFTLPEARTVTMVGLINGYAKTDGGVDWYPRQHRITRVAWVFDDGTRVEQDLKLTKEIQQLAVSVETQTVELHILETRGPGGISRARNATSISELTLQGS